MQNNRYLYLILIQLVSVFYLSAQNIGIHASQVGEWHSHVQLSPEYHYNSVAVYLINEDKILELFNPENLNRAQRKQTGVRSFDALESLYFSLQLPNPQKEGDVIDFPLYAFDIHQSKSFQVPRNQGKIIDRITDEELNGRGLEATAKIEAIKKNQLLEVAYQISSSVNKILSDRIFQNPGISGVMRKAQDFFEDKYRGKIVSEFTIPILPSNEDFEYLLHSASIYQIKWDFQEQVKLYKGNMWSDLKDKSIVSEAELRDRPNRLSRFNKHPYLVVIRYKSAYSLPEAHKLNVALSQQYLDNRLFNLQEFRKDGNQYRTEEAFLTLLRDAIDLSQNIDAFRNAKERGKASNELALKIAQQNYDLLNQYQKEVARNEKNTSDSDYFKDNYGVTYYKFFKLIDNLLFQDHQLKSIGEIPIFLADLKDADFNRFTSTDLYNYLVKLAPYRQIAVEVNQIEGDLFYKMRTQVNKIETAFQQLVFNVPPIGDKQERVKKLENLKEQYPLCQQCIEEANSQIVLIQQSIEDEQRSKLYTLQNQQLRYRKCFSDIQLKALQALKKQYPMPDSLLPLEQGLYSAYIEKVTNMESIAKQFQSIEKVSVEKLSAENLLDTLTKYEEIVNNFKNGACQLYHGSLLTKEDLICIGGACKQAIP